MNCLTDFSASALQTMEKPCFEAAPTALLVADDLGFVFWLSQVLQSVGYTAFPAKSTSAAATLIRQLHLKVDLLIIDASVTGASALIEGLRDSRPGVTAIATFGHTLPEHLKGIDGAFRKPETIDRSVEKELILNVEKIVEQRRLKLASGKRT